MGFTSLVFLHLSLLLLLLLPLFRPLPLENEFAT